MTKTRRRPKGPSSGVTFIFLCFFGLIYSITTPLEHGGEQSAEIRRHDRGAFFDADAHRASLLARPISPNAKVFKNLSDMWVTNDWGSTTWDLATIPRSSASPLQSVFDR